MDLSNAWSSSLLVVALVSALPLLAMTTLARNPALAAGFVVRLVPLAAGALLGAPLFHLLPEAVAHAGASMTVVAWTAAGATVFLVLDRALHARVGHAQHDGSGHTMALASLQPERTVALLPLLVLGDAIHNTIDGVLIAATYLDEPTLGIVTGVAVALHEMPRELGTFALFIAAGLSARRAIAINAGTAALAAIGAVTTLLLGPTMVPASGALLAFGAGTFLYLSLSLAIGEMRSVRTRGDAMLKAGLFLLGLALTFFGQHQH